MSFRSQDSTCYVEVACIHYHACDQKGTQPCVIDASAMLAQLLIRRVSSKQIAITANAFWGYSTTSKCCYLSHVTNKTLQAWCTIRELHTFAYRFQSTTGLSTHDEILPLMKGYVNPFAGKGFLYGKLLKFTTTRSFWGQGSLQKNLIKQRRLRGIGNSRMKFPKQDTVRGFSTSNTFGFHTMLIYSISNNRLDHLIEDMLGLYFFGGKIAQKYGGSYILRVYLVGAIAASVGHIAYCTILVPWLEGEPYDDFNYSMTPYVLGASAATNAFVVIHVLLFPHHIILANYFLPVPGIVFGAYLVLADIYDMYEEGTRTTHAGAIAGALSGIRLWWGIKRG